MSGQRSSVVRGRRSDQHARKLLVLDTSFSYRAIRERALEASVVCRDLGGYFEHVWTVHPFSTMLDDGRAEECGPAQFHALAPRHTFVEGVFGRFAALRRLRMINFAAGQIALLARLVALVRREQISVVRVGDPLYVGFFGWLIARACRIPLLVRAGANHDKIYETTGTPIMPRLLRTRAVEKRLEHFVFARADLVAGANEDNREFAIANGARRERTTLFRYGNLIDPVHFVPPAARPDASGILRELELEDCRFLLYVGRLEPVKHPDHVIRVVARLRETGRHVVAVLVGDGRTRQSLSELAAELGIADAVRLCGNRDQRWLASLIPRATIVLSPHTGRALAETALGAAAIVAYDVDWQRELIQDDVTGRMVPHRDWEAMAERAAELLDDPCKARRLGDAARLAAEGMMNPARLDEHERQSYDALLGPRHCVDVSGVAPSSAPFE